MFARIFLRIKVSLTFSSFPKNYPHPHPDQNMLRRADNVVYDMQDAGLAILESFDADIHDNTFTNVKYGIRISLGGGNNMVYDNVFDQCSKCE